MQLAGNSNCETALHAGAAPALLSVPSLVGGARHWYAAYVRSRHEKRVAQQLESNSLECFLPLYETLHRWKDRRAVVQLPLFPGYVFARLCSEERLRVVTTPGVVQLVGVHGSPIPVPDEEIEALRGCFARRQRMEPHPYLTSGRRVVVTKGPFADLEGILLRRKGRFRLVLSVNLIARSVAVEVDVSDVVPARHPVCRPL